MAIPPEPRAEPVATRRMDVPIVDPRPVRRRPPRRTLASDMSRLWRERRGLSIVGLMLAALVAIGAIGAIAGDDDKFTKLKTGPTTSIGAPAALVETVPTTALATSTTATTPATTSTTVVSTTRAPATTAATTPSATSPPTTAATVTTPPPTSAVFYANCTAARAAGAAPLLRGQPGYRSALDADNDGIACE